MAAIFGWHGISLQHPEDWAPVALSGDRKSGYARLASPRTLSLQLRWAPAGSESLRRALDRYLDRLSRDSRKAKGKFSREVVDDSGLLRYKYRGELDGDGVLFPTNDGRVAFLEAVGDSPTARRRHLDHAHATFHASGERWSVLGLDFTLPAPLRVEAKEFLAGRTTLKLLGRGVHVTGERWGLAESLLAQQSLSEWAAARLGRGWTVTEDGPGLMATRKSMLATETALVLDQRANKNQVTLLRVRSRRETWRPTWDWLT